MNDLSEILLKGGDGSGKMSVKGVFYRQFLPANNVLIFLSIIEFCFKLQKF